MMMMQSCEQVTELVTDYLEGRMSFWDRLRFRVHIRLCSACKHYICQMEHSIKTLGQLPDEPIPPEVEEELTKIFRDWKPSDPPEE